MARQFVFGYGSLTADLGFAPTRDLRDEGFVADLAGCVRRWGVAMDNQMDLPAYKYYTDADGSRPAVCVAYLDVVTASAGDRVNGLCLPVDDARLARLDRRERNYERVDASDRVQAGGARVWVYAGRADSRERFRAARSQGSAVIDTGYRETVRVAFAALGEAELALCEPSLDPGGLPVRALARHALP
jgi:hypothetical protein